MTVIPGAAAVAAQLDEVEVEVDDVDAADTPPGRRLRRAGPWTSLRRGR